MAVSNFNGWWLVTLLLSAFGWPNWLVNLNWSWGMPSLGDVEALMKGLTITWFYPLWKCSHLLENGYSMLQYLVETSECFLPMLSIACGWCFACGKARRWGRGLWWCFFIRWDTSASVLTSSWGSCLSLRPWWAWGAKHTGPVLVAGQRGFEVPNQVPSGFTFPLCHEGMLAGGAAVQ